MDISGSMTKEKKFLARSFFFLLYQFIRSKYEHTEHTFISHCTRANEVNEDDFFNKSSNGGTLVSTGLDKCLEIIDSRYHPSSWNVYVFQCSDGDNWPEDNDSAMSAAKSLIDLSQFYGYCEIEPRERMKRGWMSMSQLSELFGKLTSKSFKVAEIRKKDDIWLAFQRFFGGFNLSSIDLDSESLVSDAYSIGVTMGSDLLSFEGQTPEFIVWAQKDKNGAPLQRVQIIKGWVDMASGRPNEKIFDVACSDGLQPDPITQICPDNGAKVNINDCSISTNVGSSELKTIWKDPEFVTENKSFYYVRVLENPTCRWSTWDAIKSGYKPREDLHETIQERAWTSPIWYIPEESNVEVIPLGGTIQLRNID